MKSKHAQTVRTGADAIPMLVLKAIFILLIGSGMGMVYNAFSDASVFDIEDALFSAPDTEDFVSLDEAREAFDRKSAVFIDARSFAAYRDGHIPGALALPVDFFDDRGQDILSGLSRDTLIIAYCSGSSCQSSVRLAQMLAEKLNYSRVRVFYGGWDAWIAADHPVSGGAAP